MWLLCAGYRHGLLKDEVVHLQYIPVAAYTDVACRLAIANIDRGLCAWQRAPHVRIQPQQETYFWCNQSRQRSQGLPFILLRPSLWCCKSGPITASDLCDCTATIAGQPGGVPLEKSPKWHAGLAKHASILF